VSRSTKRFLTNAPKRWAIILSIRVFHSNGVTARGFGEANAVASNDTALGRQLNRRVELVLSGEVIGAQVQGETPLARAEH
jgi:hypothetical protein